MNLTLTKARLVLLAFATLLAFAAPLAAQDKAGPAATDSPDNIAAQAVSPEAQAVLDRMTAYLRGLQSYSVRTDAARDELLDLGYKLQNNERSELTVQRPNKLRAEIAGDVRNRTFVYDGTKLTMYSPDDAAFVQTDAPKTLAELIGTLLDNGVEMPLIDVLYQGTAGKLTEAVSDGVLIGQSTIDGVACDQLAFRQADIDWQLWVERGARPLPRKIVITTRYEVGSPQYQAVLYWNLQPKIDRSTFAFVRPTGATEIPLATALGAANDTP